MQTASVKPDLRFRRWVAPDGRQFLKNGRGDVVGLDYTWVGRYDGKKIDTAAQEPRDLEQLLSVMG